MNTKLKCLLLDDELPGLTYLRMICEQVPNLEVVRSFNDPVKFLEESKKLDFDFCILDIEMPYHSGIEVAQLLKNKPVIFTSAYKEYASEAFDIDAIDYIRKPIQKERLEKAIQKAGDRLLRTDTGKQYMQLNTNKGKALIFFSQVVFITSSETDKRDKLVKLENNEELVLKNISFEQVLSLLPSKDFCRVSKKDLIALKAIKFYSQSEITIAVSGKDIVFSLTESFRKDFLQKTSI